jgi:hypothetical protein
MHNLTNVLSSSPNSARKSEPPPAAPPPAAADPVEPGNPEPAKLSPAKKAARLANVERLRVLAMLEIVRYHDHNDRLALIGGLGLPTFLLLTNMFNCTLSEKRGPGQFMADMRKRLVVPWVFWSWV